MGAGGDVPPVRLDAALMLLGGSGILISVLLMFWTPSFQAPTEPGVWVEVTSSVISSDDGVIITAVGNGSVDIALTSNPLDVPSDYASLTADGELRLEASDDGRWHVLARGEAPELSILIEVDRHGLDRPLISTFFSAILLAWGIWLRYQESSLDN